MSVIDEVLAATAAKNAAELAYSWKCCDCLSFSYGGDRVHAIKTSREHRETHEHRVEHKVLQVIRDDSGRFPELKVLSSGVYGVSDIPKGAV